MATDLTSSVTDVAALDATMDVRPRRSAGDAFRRLGVAIGVTDALSILVAFALAFVLRFDASPPPFDFLLVMAMVPPLWLVIFNAWGLSSVHRVVPAEEFRRVIGAVSLIVTVVATVSFWTKAEISRGWIAISWTLSVVLVLMTRQLWHWHIGRRRASGELVFRTLVVGNNGEADALVRHLASSPEFRPVGVVGTEDRTPAGLDVPLLADLSEIRRHLRDRRADCLFVVASAVSHQQMRALAQLARRDGVELRISANLPALQSTRVSAQPVAGVLSLTLHPARLTGAQAALKRTVDIVASAAALVLLSPVLAAAAIGVLSTGRPVLYRQERVGRHGGVFTLLKFRTMVNGAHEMREGLSERNEASGPLFKIHDDPRTTRVGRFLRRWSIDELPQLINVLRGDMSLVGPRPPLPDEVRRYQDWHFDRLEVRPGITGLWQVSGRASLTFDDYVRLDLYYIENWSVAHDLFILAKTLPAVVKGRGSY
jgi:exopolysaccharide biosynthesis polyprenyl glycosylphosphotransferase